ncbi:hypothetical protein H0R92_00600 [Treponema sp. OMZ 840]|uniref:hypothetical protein n=1 Tax=Treponema sp. OMZ 840 TaxID=244313 RepID=UPI003D904DF5
MKEKTFIITAFICFFACMFVLFFFRTLPAVKIWQSYSVVYVEKQERVEDILDLFAQEGITGVLSATHTGFPPLSPFAPVQYNDKADTVFSYEDLQNLFFSDKSDAFRLYYIPEQYKEKAVKVLKTLPVTWGIDGSGAARSAVFAAVFLLFLCFAAFAKKRLFFISSFFPLVCYAAAVPLYHSAAFVCLCGYGLFIIQKFWHRRGFFGEPVIHSVFVSSFVLLCISAAFSGLRQFLLLCAAIGASCSLTYLFLKIDVFLRSRKSFVPVPIAPARTIPVRDVLCLRFALIPALCVSFFMIMVIYKPLGVSGKKVKNLYIPFPVHKTAQKDFSSTSYTRVLSYDTENRLPDLTDFVHRFWFTHTYPFRRLEKTGVEKTYVLPAIGEKVEYADYKKIGNELKEVRVTAAVFDAEYIAHIIDLIGKTQANGGAEMLLAKQNGFLRTAYARSDSIKSGSSVFIFTLAAFIYILSILSALGIKRLI